MTFEVFSGEVQVPYYFQERSHDSTVSPVIVIDANTNNIVSSGWKYHFSIRVS